MKLHVKNTNRCYWGFGKCNAFWAIAISWNLNVFCNKLRWEYPYVEISTARRSTRMHCITKTLITSIVYEKIPIVGPYNTGSYYSKHKKCQTLIKN